MFWVHQLHCLQELPYFTPHTLHLSIITLTVVLSLSAEAFPPFYRFISEEMVCHLWLTAFSLVSKLPSGLCVVLHHLQRLWLKGEAALCGQPARALQLHQTRADRHPSVCSGVRRTSKQQLTHQSLLMWRWLWITSEGAFEGKAVTPSSFHSWLSLEAESGAFRGRVNWPLIFIHDIPWCAVNSWRSPGMWVQLWHRWFFSRHASPTPLILLSTPTMV